MARPWGKDTFPTPTATFVLSLQTLLEKGQDCGVLLAPMNDKHTPPPIYTDTPSALEWVALALILFLAAWLRWTQPEVIEFKTDEANLSLMALDMAQGRDFPLLGIDSSVGIRNAPVNVYLLAVPYLFGSDPVRATQYIGLLNLIAVGLTYLLTRRYYGTAPALIAALIFAASPWAVMFSRKIWAQEMLPPFVVMTIGTGLVGFYEGKRWAQWLHIPLLVFTGQIHYGAFVLIPITVYLLWIGRRRLSRVFYLSLGIGALVALPYALGMILSSLSYPDAVQRILSSQGEGKPLTLSTQAFDFLLLLLGGSQIHAFTGPDLYPDYLLTVPNGYPLFDALAILILVCAMWQGLRALRRRDQRTPVDMIIFLWFIVPPLAFTPTWTTAYSHYLIPMLPAAGIALGVTLHEVWQGLVKWRTVQRTFVGFMVGAGAALILIQVWMLMGLFSFLDTYATTGGFGVPLSRLMPIREAILAQKPDQVLGKLDGQFIGYNLEATIWNFLLADVPVRRFLEPGMEVYPTTSALILISGCDHPDVQFKGRLRLDNGQPESCYRIEHYTPEQFDPTPFTPVPDAAPFANGVQVSGYRWDSDQGCLTVLWTTQAPGKGPKSDFFNTAVHFFGTGGEKILDADATFWNGHYWGKGDRIVREYCLQYGQERISEIAGVRLGLYTFDDTPEGRAFYGVDVLDQAGNPAGQSVEIHFP